MVAQYLCTSTCLLTLNCSNVLYLVMQRDLSNKVGFIFGFAMTIIFLACGIVFMFTDFMIENLPKPNRTYLALVFYVYVIFRSTRLYQQYKRFKLERDAEED
jgi:hypothetical protein